MDMYSSVQDKNLLRVLRDITEKEASEESTATTTDEYNNDGACENDETDHHVYVSAVPSGDDSSYVGLQRISLR